MSRFSVKPLGDLTKIKTGKLDANASSENGEYPFFTCAREPLRISSYSYDCECVLVAGNGDLNVKYYDGKFDAYQRTYIVEPRSNCNDELHVRYVYHFLEKYLETLREQSIGGIIKYIKLGNLTSASMPLPPLEEQKRIAGILDAVDALRTKRRETLEQLDQLAQSTFLEMFGDPVTNPKGWEVKKLKDVSTLILSGNTPKGGKKVYKTEGIIFFRSQNVWRNELRFDDIAFIDDDTHQRMAKSSLKNRDILITKTGRFNTENSSLGRASLFLGKDDSANINGHVYLVRLEEGSVNEFVLFILTTNEYREYIRRVCVGGIDKRQINKEHLNEFPIISPPISLQKEFASIIESIEKQKERVKAHLEELDTLFSSLQSRAFKGEL